ncbi:hypothetical protein JYT72_00295 [Crocinitomix catalasitica]|nr:hypothetical protein [Crocinitomix catalasitica]
MPKILSTPLVVMLFWVMFPIMLGGQNSSNVDIVKIDSVDELSWTKLMEKEEFEEYFPPSGITKFELDCLFFWEKVRIGQICISHLPSIWKVTIASTSHTHPVLPLWIFPEVVEPRWSAPPFQESIDLQGTTFCFRASDNYFDFEFHSEFEQEIELTIMRINPGYEPSLVDHILFQEELIIPAGTGSLERPTKYFLPGTYAISIQTEKFYRAISIQYLPSWNS